MQTKLCVQTCNARRHHQFHFLYISFFIEFFTLNHLDNIKFTFNPFNFKNSPSFTLILTKYLAIPTLFFIHFFFFYIEFQIYMLTLSTTLWFR